MLSIKEMIIKLCLSMYHTLVPSNKSEHLYDILSEGHPQFPSVISYLTFRMSISRKDSLMLNFEDIMKSLWLGYHYLHLHQKFTAFQMNIMSVKTPLLYMKDVDEICTDAEEQSTSLAL